MLLSEMAAVGPVLVLEDHGRQAAGLEDVLGDRRWAAVALAERDGGKVAGLSPATVDQLWALGPADCLVVEADGSRGLPLKAFGPHEPQVPSVTTTIVLVVGLMLWGLRSPKATSIAPAACHGARDPAARRSPRG
jgi:hypothetical protein